MFAAGVTTTAGSTTLPICALVGGTGAKISIREIGVFNLAATEVQLVLVRLSTAGTPGTSATTRELDPRDAIASVGILKNTYTSTGPTMTEMGIGFMLGAAKGSGVVLTFAPKELVVDAVANEAIGIAVDTGTGQACRVYVKWEES